MRNFALGLKESLIFPAGVSRWAIYEVATSKGLTQAEAELAIDQLVQEGGAFVEDEQVHGMLLDWDGSAEVEFPGD